MAKTAHTNRRYREDLSETPDWLKKKKCPNRDKYLSGKRIQPRNLTGKEKLADLIDNTFLAYNGARLREGCQLFTEKMLEADVTIGMSLSGALTPAGLGCSSIVPLIKAGFVDWIVATGANLYHDLHFALNYPVHVGSFKIDDTDLRNNDIVRVYDVLLGYSDCLMATDEILREILVQPGVPEGDGDGGTALPDRPVRGRVGAQGRPQGRERAGRRLPRRRALLHLVPRRLDHWHERGRRRVARQQTARQPLDRRQ